MATVDKVLREYVEWEEANVGPELPPVGQSMREECVVGGQLGDYLDAVPEEAPASAYSGIQYTVEIYGRNTVVNIKTTSEEDMAELVHMVKGFFNAC